MLTPKQEGFCKSFIETGNASEAYRLHYGAEKMKPETVNRSAKELLDNHKITARIEELRGELKEKFNLTVEDLIAELEENRQAALGNGQCGPAVSATMGKARILGLDKQIVDHRSGDGSMTPPKPVYEIVDK